jgi:23S rRNA (cytosine1962-C5)-methyltransferase
MALQKVQLLPKRDRRVRSGHPWVFSNEIDGDVSALPPGGAVDVMDSKGKFLGRGTANPNSLISVRIVSRRRDDIDNAAFWAWRIREAIELRTAALPGRTSMRLVHAEGDGLPGLVVDRYGDWLAVQLTSLGTETRRDIIRDALMTSAAPTGMVLRSEGRNRQLEGLEDERGPWVGTPPEHVDIDENGVVFRIPLLGGQKTGHFFDQATNRHHAGALCAGKTVLDMYSNSGAWALHALKQGAKSAIAVDKSTDCAERMVVNAELNGFADQFTAVQGEGRKFLQKLNAQQQQFGAVVLDPPAFAKTKKAANNALRGYTEINALGLGLITPGGFLFTSSCSFHVHEDRFIEAVNAGAAIAGRRLRMVRRGEQASDHPVDPAVPESRYLKCYAFEVRMG